MAAEGCVHIYNCNSFLSFIFSLPINTSEAEAPQALPPIPWVQGRAFEIMVPGSKTSGMGKKPSPRRAVIVGVSETHLVYVFMCNTRDTDKATPLSNFNYVLRKKIDDMDSGRYGLVNHKLMVVERTVLDENVRAVLHEKKQKLPEDERILFDEKYPLFDNKHTITDTLLTMLIDHLLKFKIERYKIFDKLEKDGKDLTENYWSLITNLQPSPPHVLDSSQPPSQPLPSFGSQFSNVLKEFPVSNRPRLPSSQPQPFQTLPSFRSQFSAVLEKFPVSGRSPPHGPAQPWAESQ